VGRIAGFYQTVFAVNGRGNHNLLSLRRGRGVCIYSIVAKAFFAGDQKLSLAEKKYGYWSPAYFCWQIMSRM